MAEKIVALVGSGKGPKVHTGMARSRLQVKAGGKGATVRVGYFSDHEQHEPSSWVEYGEGEHDMAFSKYVQVDCEGGPEALICNVMLLEA